MFVQLQRSVGWLRSLLSAQNYATLRTSVLGAVECASMPTAVGLRNGVDGCSSVYLYSFVYFIRRRKVKESEVKGSIYPTILTFRRRNYFFLILAHPVYKM